MRDCLILISQFRSLIITPAERCLLTICEICGKVCLSHY
jgi:hypothetical protein